MGRRSIRRAQPRVAVGDRVRISSTYRIRYFHGALATVREVERTWIFVEPDKPIPRDMRRLSPVRYGSAIGGRLLRVSIGQITKVPTEQEDT